MRPGLNFSVTRLLVAYGLGFLATFAAIGLVLVVIFGPGWAKVLAALFLLLDFLS